MKLNPILPLSLLLALPHAIIAQAVIDNGPELIIAGLFDSGGVPDVAIVDKQTGQVRTGLNSGATLTWSSPLLSGLSDVSAVTSGKLGLPLNEGLLLVSRAGNKLGRVSPLDASSPPMIYTVPAGAPSSTVALDFAGASPAANTNGLWLASGAFAPSAFPEVINLVTPSSTALSASAGAQSSNFVLLHGQRARVSNAGNVMAAFAGSSAADGRVFLFETLATGIPALPWRPNLRTTFAGLPAGVQSTHEYWLAGGGALFLFFTPGGSHVWHVPAALGNVTATANLDTGMPVGFLTSLNAAGAQGFIAFPQNAGAAKFFSWNGSGFTLQQTIPAPTGGRWTGALPGAGLMLLHGPADGSGTTGWQHWPLQGSGQFAFANGGSVPERILASSAHVFAFTQEPFVSPLATMTDARRVTDWTAGPLVLPGSRAMIVNRESYAGAAPGLGSPASFNAGTAPAGSAWMLANQYAPDISVAALSSEKIVLTAPMVEISPPPRHREMTGLVPAVTETLSFLPSGGALVWYRTAPTQSFQQYNAATPPVITVTALPQTITVEYFATSGAARNRLQLATYTFGPAGSLTSPSGTDSDLDGLSDAWETYYGLTDPNGDPDGDGMNNLTEQNTGSDPLGPCLPAELPDLAMESLAGGISLRFTRPLVPGEALERTTDLTTWQAVKLPVNATSYSDPATSTRRYYRLRR